MKLQLEHQIHTICFAKKRLKKYIFEDNMNMNLFDFIEQTLLSSDEEHTHKGLDLFKKAFDVEFSFTKSFGPFSSIRKTELNSYEYKDDDYFFQICLIEKSDK
jgi:hypothetical protein